MAQRSDGRVTASVHGATPDHSDHDRQSPEYRQVPGLVRTDPLGASGAKPPTPASRLTSRQGPTFFGPEPGAPFYDFRRIHRAGRES